MSTEFKMREIDKMIAETRKLSRETLWYPFVVGVGTVAATIIATLALLRAMGGYQVNGR